MTKKVKMYLALYILPATGIFFYICIAIYFVENHEFIDDCYYYCESVFDDIKQSFYGDDYDNLGILQYIIKGGLFILYVISMLIALSLILIGIPLLICTVGFTVPLYYLLQYYSIQLVYGNRYRYYLLDFIDDHREIVREIKNKNKELNND